MTSLTVTLDFFTTLLLGHGHGIVPHGELVFVVSLLPVVPIFICNLAHPSILLMFGIVLCKCSGNVLIGYVIFKIK